MLSDFNNLCSIFFFVFLIVVINNISISKSRLIHVNLLQRYCDKVPTTSFKLKNDPIDWEQKIGTGTGSLTGYGMTQCRELGFEIKKRYFNQSSPNFIHNIKTNYYAHHQHFYASSIQRALLSAVSTSGGIFDQKGPINDITGLPALPGRFDPVPIRTKILINDEIFMGSDNCPNLITIIKNYKKSSKYSQLTQKYQSLFSQIQSKIGNEVKTISNFLNCFSLIKAQKEHNLLKITGFEDNSQLWNQMCLAAQEIHGQRREYGDNIEGGPFLERVHRNMETAIERHDKNITGSHERYVHFSGQGNNILSVLQALKLLKDYPTFSNPLNYDFGSVISIELHESDTTKKKFFIRIFYKKRYNSKWEKLQLKTLGCDKEDCDYEKYVELTKKYSFVSLKDWCDKCDNNFSDFCSLEKEVEAEDTIRIYQLLLIFVFILLLIVVFILFLFCLGSMALCVRIVSLQKTLNSYKVKQINEDSIVSALLDED